MPNVPPSEASPAAVVAASLRRERRRAGVTLTELARRAGVGKSTLSELESGTGNPSLETLWALADALEMPVSALLEPPRPQVRLIRAGEGVTVVADTTRYVTTLLAAVHSSARTDLYRVTAEPGEPRRSDPHLPGLVEHVVLATGRALIGLDAAPETLHPGDYLSYPGDQPHVFGALARGTTAVLIQEIPRQ